ncbi:MULTISPECIES: hypothetical protein [Pseudomonas]|uniref:hypothetical protein n=1 Tax=Pseudomonas TaxID=286 RepID=UPI0012E387A1|nr:MULTISPECIES: hypothetical protein [Pseudomonas]WHS57608.1 hypothetical protein QLH64_30105 [Pseudomonas brassicacearum]
MKAKRSLSYRLALTSAAAILSGSISISHATPSTFVSSDDPRLTPARVKTFTQGGFKQIFVDGYIHKATVDSVSEAMQPVTTQYGMVVFNSAGGDLIAAQELGQLIRDHGFATQIGKLTENQDQVARGVCESACPIAFIGGKFRLLDTDTGHLGVHRFYLAKQGRWAADSKLLFTAGRDLREYIKAMGVSDEFFTLIMATPADRIQAVGKHASYDWNLSTGGEFTTWNLAPDGSLVGLGETSTGGMGITLACREGKPSLSAKFKPWFPPATLLNYDTHNVTVDNDRYPVTEATASYDKQSGFITFQAGVTREAIKAIARADRVGYSLSYDRGPGEYSRSLVIDGQAKSLAETFESCPTK